MLNFDFLEMGLGTVFSKHNILSMVFREKCFSFYILLTDQILLPECLFLLSIGQYGYCLLTRLRRHKF